MYLLFTDESGTAPESAKGEQRYFVIAGLVIPAAEWREVANRLQGIKTRRRLKGELKWRYFSPNNESHDNPMRGMKFDDRNQVRAEVFKILTTFKSLRVIAAVASVPAAFGMTSINNSSDLYRLTFKVLTERFQYYLQDLSRQTGSPECGMIVSDHRGADNDRVLRMHYQRMIESPGTFTSKYLNVIETLLFAPSHMSPGVQLADLVAGAIWRKFERGDDQWYQALAPAIRTGPGGVIDGFGIVKVPKLGWR